MLDMKIELEIRDRFVRDSTILGIRHKIQRAANQFLENEWLQATQAILINSLGQRTISESVFWSKTFDAHYPLGGNGLSDTGDRKQPTQKGDCLYTAAILATERYSQVVDAVEYETQFLKQGTINQLKKIVQHFYDPARPTEHANSGIYSVRRATLLGQLLQVLSPSELELYVKSMENDAQHPAGPLDICVLSHLMKKDIQVYRQVDELQEQVL
jgi:hypothetical protein